MPIQPTVLHPENSPDVDLHPETDAGQVTDFLNKTYPVDSIYLSIGSTSPASLFGGTWTKINAGYLMTSGYMSTNVGDTGGNINYYLSSRNLPSSTVCMGRNNMGSDMSSTLVVYPLNNINVPDGAYFYASKSIIQTKYDPSYESDKELKITPPYIAINVWKRVA